MQSNDTERGNNNPQSSSSFPIEYRETHIQWTSWLVPMFVVANVVVFLVVMYINNCPHHFHSRFQGKCVATFLGRFSFEPLRDNPLFGPSSSTLRKLGGLEWERVVTYHEGWRLITCIWLQAGVIHLLANMMGLIFIGIRLEQQFGFIRIGAIYLVSGLGGTILSSLFLRNTISVGASGALFGLLGAMLAELITNWSIYTNKGGALFTLVVIIAVNLALGILPHVDNYAHIGGFMSGFLLGFILLPRPQLGWFDNQNLGVKSKYKLYQYVLWAVSLVLLVVGYTAGLVLLFRGANGNNGCHWCHYLSCVPTSRWKCNENQF